jgi:hypothetical protein
MIFEVKLFCGGRIFVEEVHANDPKSARETALARNPTAKIVGVNGSRKN